MAFGNRDIVKFNNESLCNVKSHTRVESVPKVFSFIACDKSPLVSVVGTNKGRNKEHTERYVSLLIMEL